MTNYKRNIFSIGFYNVENLFDTVDNPHKNDDQYTKKGNRKWDRKKYFKKIKKLSHVISQIGKEYTNEAPILVGLVEVENNIVLNDLIQHKNLKKYNYKFVHYESMDERGIDVALIYRHQLFEYKSSKKYALQFVEEDGKTDYTRDILVVSGFINDELTHIIVNHWPSRSEGEKESKYKRILAAKRVHEVIDDLKKAHKDPKIVIMGDFNDNPTNESIEDHLVSKELYNPMKKVFKKGIGSLTYKRKWDLFDQIIISKNFLNSNNGKNSFVKAKVFNKKWLKVYKGKRKGSPFRTYVGPWYEGGYSDHFPVFACFKKDQ